MVEGLQSFSGNDGVPVDTLYDALYDVFENVILSLFINKNLKKCLAMCFRTGSAQRNDDCKSSTNNTLKELAEKKDDYKKFAQFSSSPVTS